jgi:MoaA/NifB/PqqE/SkfB family radical SAM enzyme
MTLSQAYNLVVSQSQAASLVHFVTDRCNARCPFCFIDFASPSHGKNELSLEEIERMTKLLPSSLANVNFTGGEPFLRKDLVEIAYAYFSNTAIGSIFITSNGYFTERTKTFCEEVLGRFPEKELFIALSIDALPAAHDSIRRVRDLFAHCLETFHMLRSLNINVRPSVSITVSEENHGQVTELYDALIDRHGVDAVQLIMVRSEGVYSLGPDAEDRVLAAYRMLSARVENDYQTGKLKGFDRASWKGRVLNAKNALSRNTLADYVGRPRHILPCKAATLFGVITSTGDVYPCEVLDRPLGNLRDYDYDLKKIWADRAAQETRHFIRDTKCHCSYECALSVNLLSYRGKMAGLAKAALG